MSNKIKVYKPSKKHKKIYKRFIKDEDGPLFLFLQGAVRAGKTRLAIVLSIKYLQGLPACNVLISGNGTDSVKRVIVGEWEGILNKSFKVHKGALGEYYTVDYPGLRNKRLYIRGGGKNGDEKLIQGLTLGFWFNDETTNITKDFFNMALSRLSLPYSKAIFTLNPDHENHWLKLWLDENKNNPDVESYKFSIDDNPSLSEKIKNRYKQMFKGTFYKRMILGEWGTGENNIYDDSQVIWEKIDYDPSFYEQRFIVMDYGFTNPSAILVVGKRGKHFYFIDEFYKNQQLNGDLVNVINKFKNQYDIKNPIIVDPSASAFKGELGARGIMYQNAYNDVIGGIVETIANMNMGFIHIDRDKCPNLTKELLGYCWDPERPEHPVKENDHAVDAMRYSVFTINKLYGGLLNGIYT